MNVNRTNELIFLGTGTSTGIPVPTCDCRVCLHSDLKNTRLRSSIFIKTRANNSILIDTTPDLRTQVLREGIKNIDAAIVTHDHADHLNGMDDLRPFTFNSTKKSLPVYCSLKHSSSLEIKFDYIFKRHKIFNKDNPYLGGGLPLLDLHPLSEGRHQILDEQFEFYYLPHGSTETFSFRHQGLVYLIDCHNIPESLVSTFRDNPPVVMIIDCLQEKPHQTHLTRAQAFAYINEIKPQMAYLTHMNHDLEHSELQSLADKHCLVPTKVAYDGLKVSY